MAISFAAQRFRHAYYFLWSSEKFKDLTTLRPFRPLREKGRDRERITRQRQADRFDLNFNDRS